MKSILFATLAISIETVLAQAAGWAQCGGIGYTGSTSCTGGFACTSDNPYYFQCIPSTSTASVTTTTSSQTTTTTSTSKSTTTTSTSKSTTTSTSSTTSSSTSSSVSSTGPTCTGTWTDVTAAQFVQNISPGWNLGNTLDAIPTEGSWNNAPVVLSTFETVKSAGFKGVRIPVTWIDHFTSDAPNYTVDPTWLARVSAVVDMATSQGLYTIVNVHHDATDWADITTSGANITEIEQKFYQLWYQIGTTLACKPSLVAFETINEPPCTDQSDGDEINKLNAIMLEAINAAGGWNSNRVVTLVGCSEDSIDTSEWFVAPTGYTNPYAIQFHYYSPYEFVFSAWGSTIWGSAADEAALAADFANIRGNFTDVPLVIGEYSGSPASTEPAARWKYTDFLAKTAVEYNMGYILWDNGADYLDRTIDQWRDPTSIQLILDEAQGIESALPDSTEDSSATTQWTSAYIFHQRGTAVTAQSLPFIFNGNTLESISDSTGITLTSGTDYSVSGSNITFASSYLSKHYSSTTSPGVLANLTLTFSAGAQPVIQVVQWDQPTLGSTSAVASAVSGGDLTIPITWAGVEEVATVKAIEANGVYLQNTWTVYLPTLQQARLTYSSDYTWTSSSVTILQADIEDVVAAGETTVFTFEFYPRDNGVYNAVNFTLTV